MKLQILTSGREARLLEDYTVETTVGRVTIPKGFKTDFASVPQLFWSIVPPMGKYFVAAVLHDYFYRMPGARTVEIYFSILPKSGSVLQTIHVTREIADTIFLEEMRDAKVSWWKRRMMYRAVRIGGAWSWVEPEEDKT